tara:strand:+ start:138064 stop:139743 length:1680 start_codon:yes stop_codon:yes gene_type:complete
MPTNHYMKKILLFSFILFFFLNCFSQEEVIELPASWKYNIHNRMSPVNLPPLNLHNIAQEDSINDLDKSLPWRYGIERSVNLDLVNDGVWTSLPEGGRIWQVGIKSPNALNLSIKFDKFYLPEGARLHLYNGDGSDLSKTISNNENTPNRLFGSWFITGDVIWIEYFEPEYVSEEVQLEIGSIIHGYRMGEVNQLIDSSRGLNDSGDCNYDVNCPIGGDFENEKNILKKTVALLSLGNGYLCSAVLMNNTREDKTPYLLTANHCLENSDPSFWSIRFNWMSPNPVCGTGEDSVDIQTNFTMSGAEYKASNALSDFALVELYNLIPSSWDIAFSGWDMSDTPPVFEVGIHHPNGDIMKICRDDSGAVKENANGTEVWLIGGVTEGTGDGWEIGTTESGSSGSPLFNQNGRLIGQLYAGQSFCNGLVNNNDYDIYGRFGVSWDAGATEDSRLKEWLDPINTGQFTIGSLQNLLNVPDIEVTGTLQIFPNPASSEITILNNRYPNLSYTFYNAIGQVLIEGNASNSMSLINVDGFSEGMYFLRLVDGEGDSETTKKIIIDRQ